MPIRERREDRVLRVELEGAVSIEELDAHFDRMTDLLGELEGPVATLVDATRMQTTGLTPALGSTAWRRFRALRPLLRGRYRAQAFVHPDARVRRAVRWTHRLAPVAERHGEHATAAEAAEWLRAQLA